MPKPRTSCWAYKDGDCTLLKECFCRKGKCGHYQTQQQLDASNERSRKRLERLGYGQRKSIKK
ncbi:MAG: hypothetical protein J1F23_08765 [Oscillospiraceae bacterium]|nr:hypothetical protein [Oscillospiraceae bacterium]